MLLLFLLLAFQASPQAAPKAVSVVAGTVLSERDRHPVAHATVALFDEGARTTALTTYTDESGHYEFAAVPAGRYALSAAARGYITGSYLQHGLFSTAVILGTGLPTADLTFTISPAATLSGTLTDESDPIINASVQLFREDLTSSEHIETFRNAPVLNGRFEFTDLPAGRYYLCASAQPWYSVIPRRDPREAKSARYRVSVDPALQVLYPEVYYPDARDSNAAMPIEIHPGEQFTANLHMHPEHPVSFVVRLPPDAAPKAPPVQPKTADDEEAMIPRENVVTLSQMVFGKEVFVQAGFDTEDGTIVARGLLPGHYIVSQSGPDGGPSVHVGEVDLANSSTSFSMPGVGTQASVTVTVRGYEKKTASGQEATVSFHDLKNPAITDFSPDQSADEKGHTLFPSLPPSDYRFSVMLSGAGGEFNTRRELHVETVTINGRPAPDKQLHLTGPGKFSVVLTVSQSRVTVQGLALHDGKPVPGAMIVLVPAGQDAREDLFRRDQSDLDGTFNLIDAEPGKYILIAVEDGWPLRWNDATALAPYLAHGIPVDIPTSASGKFRAQSPIQTVSR